MFYILILKLGKLYRFFKSTLLTKFKWKKEKTGLLNNVSNFELLR